MIASEVAPFAKAGGLADVAGALSKYLHRAGHDVRLFTPLYSQIDRPQFEWQRPPGMQELPLEFGGHRYRYSLWLARMPNSDAQVHFVDIPVLYARSGIYSDDADEHLRFLALTRAAIECCQHFGWAPQVLHCNDWHTAFAPLLLRSVYAWDRLFAATRTLLTIHNIGYQGIFPAARAGDIGLGDAAHLLHQSDLAAGQVNSLKHGILYADLVSTVSPTYAREILTPEFGMGLHAELSARAAHGGLVGILNGVDYEEWDPRWDRWLPKHYGPRELHVKAELKALLLKRLELHAAGDVLLLGIVSRFTAQKGLELLVDALPPLLEEGALACVALGSGETRYEEHFAQLQRRFSRRVIFHRGYSDELAHWIEAASDAFAMPSRYEPCGLNQMYSLRYGTIPIVRRTGGLADTVQMYDPATGTGNGIVFNDFDAAGLSWALRTALQLYRQPAHWQRMMRNAMAADYSWDRQGAHYERLYARLVNATADRRDLGAAEKTAPTTNPD
ncbi:MAG: glycogen synthase [Steroidobacteraceae bacterium]|nr:glycogen synthase [Steroidobacteraceae bacterium]MDW8259660.1 glycogen synthase [Gammaproteobacteria bacterium]